MSKIILDHSELKRVVDRLKTEGKTVVFTNGCFDLLHVGHVRCLKGAKEMGDVLVVAVNSDAWIQRHKRERGSFHPQEERLEILEALECVDILTVFDEPKVDGLLMKLQPHVHAKGTDYTLDSVPERETVLSYGGKIAIVGDPKNHSSSELIEKAQRTRS